MSDRTRKAPAVAALVGVGWLLAAGVFGAVTSCGGPKFSGMSGAQVYKRACQSCHGPDGRAFGGKGSAPSYRGVRDDWDEESLLRYIDDPKAFKKTTDIARLKSSRRYMPPIHPAVSEETRRELVRHVLGLMDRLRLE